MATAKWDTPVAIATILSTDLNALANGAYSAASAAVNNETGLNLYASFELYLASLTPAAGGYCAVHILYSLDGTNFADGGGATAPSAGSLVCTFDLSTATAVKRHVRGNILLAPYQFKVVLLNAAGAALAATGNTLKYRVHSEQIA